MSDLKAPVGLGVVLLLPLLIVGSFRLGLPEVVGEVSRQPFGARNVVLSLQQGEDIAQANQVSANRLVDRLPLVASDLIADWAMCPLSVRAPRTAAGAASIEAETGTVSPASKVGSSVPGPGAPLTSPGPFIRVSRGRT